MDFLILIAAGIITFISPNYDYKNAATDSVFQKLTGNTTQNSIVIAKVSKKSPWTEIDKLNI